jgi:hypothetical protein
MVDNTNREEIGQTGGMGTSATGSLNRGETAGQKVKQGWNEFKTKVRGKWNQLTDKDIDTYQNRNRNDFVGYVHGKVGGDRTMVERDIDTFARDTNYRW